MTNEQKTIMFLLGCMIGMALWIAIYLFFGSSCE